MDSTSLISVFNENFARIGISHRFMQLHVYFFYPFILKERSFANKIKSFKIQPEIQYSDAETCAPHQTSIFGHYTCCNICKTINLHCHFIHNALQLVQLSISLLSLARSWHHWVALTSVIFVSWGSTEAGTSSSLAILLLGSILGLALFIGTSWPPSLLSFTSPSFFSSFFSVGVRAWFWDAWLAALAYTECMFSFCPTIPIQTNSDMYKMEEILMRKTLGRKKHHQFLITSKTHPLIPVRYGQSWW